MIKNIISTLVVVVVVAAVVKNLKSLRGRQTGGGSGDPYIVCSKDHLKILMEKFGTTLNDLDRV